VTRKIDPPVHRLLALEAEWAGQNKAAVNLEDSACHLSALVEDIQVV